MVNIRNSLGAKVDTALVNLTTNRSSLDTKLESLEGLIKDNLKQNNELALAITDLSLTIKNSSSKINIDTTQIEEIAVSVTNHPSLANLSTTLSRLRCEVAKSDNLSAVQGELQGLTTSMATMESKVKDISKKVTDTNEAATKDMAQMRKNSDRSLGLFDTMKQSLEILAKQASTSDTPLPSSTPIVPTSNATTEPRTYKGIMFASNSAVDIDTKKIKIILIVTLRSFPLSMSCPTVTLVTLTPTSRAWSTNTWQGKVVMTLQ